MKNGETTILRADLQNIRSVMEKREVEASQQIASLQKKVTLIDTQYSKQLEASKTEMRFKVGVHPYIFNSVLHFKY